jgi:hypothetical protein
MAASRPYHVRPLNESVHVKKSVIFWLTPAVLCRAVIKKLYTFYPYLFGSLWSRLPTMVQPSAGTVLRADGLVVDQVSLR